MPDDIPEVLFVCVHNAGRSQMAAALLDHHAQGRVRVRSGGSAPGERIDPAVAEALAEIGLDLSKEFPKPVTDEAVRGGRRRHHHGLRRRLPHLPREALRGLGSRGSGGQAGRAGPTGPRRDRPPGAGSAERADQQ